MGTWMPFNVMSSIRVYWTWDINHRKAPLPLYSTHSLPLRRAGRGGSRQTFLADRQLAVGLLQGLLQFVDARLVLQQNILRLIQKLEEKLQQEGEKEEARNALAKRWHAFTSRTHINIWYAWLNKTWESTEEEDAMWTLTLMLTKAGVLRLSCGPWRALTFQMLLKLQ